MKQYDFIMVGGGAAGRSLAYRLARSPLRDRSILIVDRALREPPHRTWAFWSTTPGPFDSLACRTWPRLRIATPGSQQIHELGRYRYKVIRGADFYRFTHDQLAGRPNVDFLQGCVEKIADGSASARIYVDRHEYAGRWVFDSRFRLADFHPNSRRYGYLQMQFRGWEIQTPTARFDPQTPTFLDFRTPQRGQMRFLYVLPYAPHQALVEYVAYTNQLRCRAAEHQALDQYIREVLGLDAYWIVAEEHGISPLTDYPFPRRQGRRVMSIGVPAGMLKPTTGFAFTRIQRDSAAIVRSLVERGHPFGVPAPAGGYRMADALLLRAIARHGGHMGAVLAMLFKYGSTERILRFLDERGTPF